MRFRQAQFLSGNAQISARATYAVAIRHQCTMFSVHDGDFSRYIAVSWVRSCNNVSRNRFDPDRDWTRPIKNRHIALHLAKQNDPGLGNTSISIVNDEVIGAPKAECTR